MRDLMQLKQTQTRSCWSLNAFLVVLVGGLVAGVAGLSSAAPGTAGMPIVTEAADLEAGPVRLAYGGPEPMWGGPVDPWTHAVGQQFDLVDGYWRLRLLNGNLLVAGRTITAQFAGGRIVGSGGISRYSADYSSSRNRLTIGQVRAERTMGPAGQMSQEQEYFRTLRRAAWYSIAIRQLTVYDERGRVLLNFEQGTLVNPPRYDGRRPPYRDERPPYRDGRWPRDGRDGRG